MRYLLAAALTVLVLLFLLVARYYSIKRQLSQGVIAPQVVVTAVAPTYHNQVSLDIPNPFEDVGALPYHGRALLHSLRNQPPTQDIDMDAPDWVQQVEEHLS